MPYTPYPLIDFGAGLNLTAKADAVGPGEAIDALNVVFTDRGAVQQRDGYADFNSTALTNAVSTLEPFYTTSGTKQLLCGCGTRLEALNTSGAIVASATGLTDGTWDFARFGSPNSETAYAGNGQNLLRKWNGSAWSSIANSPKAGALAITPTSNRLVATRFLTTTGGPSAGTSSPSHAYFSDAGDPETFGASNYVQLTPGDGEQIQAAISWREYLFVFKESRFFVFAGEGTDSSGNPIFDYRAIDTGVGLVGPKAVCATETGVYFASRRGVFLTTGAEPVKVSGPVDPIFLGGAESYFLGGDLDHSLATSICLGTHRDSLYVGYSTATANNRALVYDFTEGWWSLWDTPASCFGQFRISSEEELIFGYASGSNRVGRMNSSLLSDAGTAISSRYRMGFSDYGIPENKAIRQVKLWGSGKCFSALSADYAIDTGRLVAHDFTTTGSTEWDSSTWGGGEWKAVPSLNPKIRRSALRGTVFSLAFTNDILNQSWSIHRAEAHLRGVRQPTVRKTETAA